MSLSFDFGLFSSSIGTKIDLMIDGIQMVELTCIYTHPKGRKGASLGLLVQGGPT